MSESRLEKLKINFSGLQVHIYFVFVMIDPVNFQESSGIFCEYLSVNKLCDLK